MKECLSAHGFSIHGSHIGMISLYRKKQVGQKEQASGPQKFEK